MAATDSTKPDVYECSVCGKELSSERGKKSHEAQTHNKEFPYDDPEKLHEEYVVNQKSPRQIADEFGCTDETIRNKLDNFEIDKRTHGEAVSLGYLSSEPPKMLYNSDNGYEYFKNYHRGKNYIFNHHQLLAIHKGADPYKVFSNGEYDVHHKNEIPWDNRVENIELIEHGEHRRHHIRQR